jgi:cysteine desulfurase
MFRKRRIYLDWAASAPADARAKRAFGHALSSYGNPSSPHEEGRRAKAILEDARTRIARATSAKADDVVFTANATEANNLAILGHARALMHEGASRMPARVANSIHFLYLPSAHASVVEAMEEAERLGCSIEPLVVKEGAIDISALAQQVRPETALVSIDAVCGETGTIWNAREVRHALDAARAASPRILLHVDASQAPLAESPNRTRFGADLLTLDTSKIGGIRGIGALIAPRTIPLEPLVRGGGQERGLRPGTESPALAAAFAEALEARAEDHAAFAPRALRARISFLARLSAAHLPNVHINESAKQAPHILNLSIVGRDTDYLVALLDQAGIAVSTKSACETDSETGSRAVLALTGEAARAASTLRISWGPATSERALLRAADELIKAVRFLDSSALA